MQKIGDSTATANGAGEFTQGQPGSGIDATMITAAWLNAIQREAANVVLGAGIALNPSDDSQLFKAIQAIQAAAHSWAKLTGKPTTVAGYGLTDAFTKTETSNAIQQAVAALVASSPAALDTLNELAEALGNDPNFATTMTNALASKANKATSLLGYGITDTYTKDQIEAMIAQASALPVGSIIGFPVNKIAPGFLELDGSVKSAAAYPDLATFLGGLFNKGDEGAGNFRLPESRAEFLRGWDHGRGIDIGRAVGSYQSDEIKKHRHPQYEYDTNDSTPIPDLSRAFDLNANYAVGREVTALIGYTGGSETRPRNLAVIWCIKAWNAPINQGSIDIAMLVPLAAQATEINQGTAKVATDAQMLDSANDAVMATPKKLRKGFAVSLGLNGHIVFPSWLGGLILQWGSVPVSSSSAALSFPIEFPNVLYTVVGSPIGSAASSGAGGGAISTGTRIGATVYVWGTGNFTFRWMALGS